MRSSKRIMVGGHLDPDDPYKYCVNIGGEDRCYTTSSEPNTDKWDAEIQRWETLARQYNQDESDLKFVERERDKSLVKQKEAEMQEIVEELSEAALRKPKTSKESPEEKFVSDVRRFNINVSARQLFLIGGISALITTVIFVSDFSLKWGISSWIYFIGYMFSGACFIFGLLDSYSAKSRRYTRVFVIILSIGVSLLLFFEIIPIPYPWNIASGILFILNAAALAIHQFVLTNEDRKSEIFYAIVAAGLLILVWLPDIIPIDNGWKTALTFILIITVISVTFRSVRIIISLSATFIGALFFIIDLPSVSETNLNIVRGLGLGIGIVLIVSSLAATVIKNKKTTKMILQKCDTYNGDMIGSRCYIEMNEKDCGEIGGIFENDKCVL